MFNLSIDSKQRSRLITAAALLFLALSLIFVAVQLKDESNDADSVASTTTIPGSSSTTMTENPIPPRIEQIQKFVSEQRGLAFLLEPKIEFLSEEEFDSSLSEHLTRTLDLDALSESTELFTALGLIPVGTDVSEPILEYLRLRTVGYFDSGLGLVRLRGDELTPMTELVLVHELTHALDDQHFGVDSSRFAERDDESVFAFQALVEGSADLIESAWFDQMTSAEISELGSERSALPVAPALPDSVLSALSFAHVSGEPYARAVVAAGGADLLNEAFLHPPRTSEQIIELQVPGSEEVIAEIALPEIDAEVESSGTLGALTLRLLLETVEPRGDAWNLSLQWGGDSYVLWHRRSAACVSVDFAAESGPSQILLADALEQVAGNRLGTASVERFDGITRFTACG